MQAIIQKHIRFTFIALLFIGSNVFAGTNPGASDSLLKQKSILNIMHRVADWQLNQWNTKGFTHPPVDWTNAACYTGIYALGAIKGNDQYLDALVKISTDLNWQIGPNRFTADDYCVGQTYSLLSIRYHDKKMIAPFITLADSIVNKPHDEPLDWKNNIASREWAWCDALFMAPTALGYLSKATNNPAYKFTAMCISAFFSRDGLLYNSQNACKPNKVLPRQ